MAERRTVTTNGDKEKLDPVLESDKAHAGEGVSSAHLDAAADAERAHAAALQQAEEAATEARRTGKPTPITAATLVAEGQKQADARKDKDFGMPVPYGCRRVAIKEAFELKRPDGSSAKFRPDGTNCDQPGFYDVPIEDIKLWYSAFGVRPDELDDRPPPPDQTATPPDMKRVHVMKNFYLHSDTGIVTEYKTTGTNCGLPGYYDMQPVDADHWMTRGCSDNPPPPPPPMAGTQAAQDLITREKQKRVLVETVLDQQEQEVLDNKRASRAQRMKDALGDSFQETM